MRLLTTANYHQTWNNKFLLDQMLFYLMQLKQPLETVKMLKTYAELPDDDKYKFYELDETKSKKVINTDNFWECSELNVDTGRKMLLYRNDKTDDSNKAIPFMKNWNAEHFKTYMGSECMSKFDSVTNYVKNANGDRFAGYCVNTDFITPEGHKFRAYDFAYKNLQDKCLMNSVWDVYNYRPTSIFTVDGTVYGSNKLRTFDYKKRAKSNYLIAPSVIDRVLMFEPHHLLTNKNKVYFLKY
jgi:hypothetical protein